MRPLYQRLVILGIWVVALGEATRQGLSVPQLYPAIHPGDPLYTLRDWQSFKTFNWNVVWFGLFGPSVVMCGYRLLASVFPFMRRRSATRFSVWIDRRWGQGTMALFTGRLRGKALMVVAALVLGVSAVLACEQEKASSMAFHVAMFFLGGGVGTTAAYLLEEYFNKHHIVF